MIARLPTLSIARCPDGRGWQLRSEQWLPARVDAVFAFFQDPYNLERITPPFLRFHVLGSSTPAVTAHTRLWYRLSLHGVPMWWRTRIDAWSPPRRFVDVQEWGPYRLWHHTHEFIELDGGTLMRDVVHYELWLQPLMPAFISRWVQRDVRSIFEYRQSVVASMFAAQAPAPSSSRPAAAAG